MSSAERVLVQMPRCGTSYTGTTYIIIHVYVYTYIEIARVHVLIHVDKVSYYTLGTCWLHQRLERGPSKAKVWQRARERERERERESLSMFRRISTIA